MIGSPISGMLLSLDGTWGLRGWQWLYLIEGLPAIIMGPIVAFYLQDRVSDGKWLAPQQRDWLSGKLQSELQTREEKRKYSVMEALTNPWVLFLGAVYFSNVCLNQAVGPFLPQIIKSFGLTNTQTGFVSAIPYVCAVICVIWWGRRSDRQVERYGHAALATFLGGAGLLAAMLISEPVMRVAAFALAISGTLSFAPVFWSIAPSFLSGRAAAGGLAFISAMGIVGGWMTPFYVGYLKDMTGNFTWGLGSVAVFGMVAGIALYAIGRRQDSAIELPAGADVVSGHRVSS
jgi:nitrate/nitrite transporter NarK